MALLLGLAGCVGESDAQEGSLDASQDVERSAEELRIIGAYCDRVESREHFVDVGDGVQLHVIERFSGRSMLRFPHRAILMIPATLTNNDLYDAQVEGDDSYNVMNRAAREGYYAFSVSYEGYGQSTLAANGADVTAERSLVQMGEVIEWIRRARHAPRVDVLGTSVGSDIAIALGGLQSSINYRHVGHVILTATVYRAFSPFVQEHAFTPDFQAFLLSIPDGYVETVPPFYDLVITEVEDPVRAWAYATFPGVYATGPTLEAFDLPVVDATLGRAPALLFYGTRDPVTTAEDAYALEAEYGGPIRLVEMENGGHSTFLEPDREQFWDETLSFLTEGERHSFSLCDLVQH